METGQKTAASGATSGSLIADEAVVREGTPTSPAPDVTVPPGITVPLDVAMPFDVDVPPDVAVSFDVPPDDTVPPGGPFEGEPPDAVPVPFWPVDVLRQALTGAPGSRLARVVAEAVDADDNMGAGATGEGPLADLPDDALGDLVTACGRLQSWAAGLQAQVVAERAARESHPLAHNSLVGQVTSELVVTEPEATEVVVRAESGAQHPTVISALTSGRIDVRKAHTLLRSASQLTVAERAEAIARFLPHAPRRTWRWLRDRMLTFAKARHGAAETAKAAAQRRGVQLDRAENDMGWLSAYLPAVDAAAVWGVVDDMAHQLRHAVGEERTLGQLRADSLTGIVTGRLLPADRYTDTSTSTSTETGTSPGPGAGPGDGPRSGVDPRSGTSSETGTTTDPRPTTDTDTDPRPDTNGAVDQDGPVCTCGGRAPVVEHVVQEVVRPVRITPTRPVVRVTVSAGTLLGLDDAPGELRGFGPIPADVARAIATDATWQRLLTDPSTGILTDYSTTTYRPGKVLSAAVQARDETCTFLLGCDSPAVWDDLDHIVPFDHDLDPATVPPGTPGQTRATNLHALCRKHHLLKTHAGWGVLRDPDTGITTWTTPAGRRYERPPTVLDPHVDLDQVDPDTSGDLALRALTGQRLPRSYTISEPAAPGGATDRSDPPF